jgi:hypothetical protein
VAELVMALRCIDGMVVGGDVPLGDVPPERRVIRPLSDHLVMLLHGPAAPGNRLLDEWLQSSPSFDLPMAEVAKACHASVTRGFEQWAKKERGIHSLGLILTGTDVHGTGDMDAYGLYAGGGFEPRHYSGNVFGGEFTAIARLIDRKVHSFSISVASGLRRAAFYFVESRTVLNRAIQPSLALGTITLDKGFEALSRQQVTTQLQEAARWSERLMAACANLALLPQAEDGEER